MKHAGSRRRRPSLADARSRHGGRYVALGDGVTHFRVEGPAGGAPLVLLHGATVPLWELDALVPHLGAAGFRTLRFDFFGHGLSDRPAIRYPLELFVRQTLELIEAVGFPQPAAILGHSVGAAVAAAAAARTERFRRVALVAPLLDFERTARSAAACPGVGELVMRLVALPALVRRRRARYAAIGRPELTERFLEQAALDGFSRALLAMLRAGTLHDHGPRYAALARLRRELIVISGEADRVVPRRDVARVGELVGPHVHLEIAGAEHNLLLTHPQTVAAALQRFTQQPNARALATFAAAMPAPD